MAGCGGCAAVAKGNQSLVEFLVCGQMLWEHRFTQLEILSLFNSGSSALLMKTYLLVLHSEQLLSLPYWTFPGLNKAVLLSVGFVFLCRLFFCLVPLKSTFYLSSNADGFVELEMNCHDKYCFSWAELAAQSRSWGVPDEQRCNMSSPRVPQYFCFHLETQKWEAL